MTTIAVLPDPTGVPGDRAITDGTEAAGATPGAAIDALVGRPGGPTGTMLILLQSAGADEFFTADQQLRLADLMIRWRQARDAGASLPALKQAELDSGIASELQAATARTAAALGFVQL